MILADHNITKAHNTGYLKIDPWHPENVQPSSLDVRLAVGLTEMNTGKYKTVNPLDIPTDLMLDRPHYLLYPNQFCLGSTVECVHLPDDIAAQLEGKSSLARLGLLVHATAGFIDPGFQGQITMEMKNIGDMAILLYPGMLVAQLVFHQMRAPVERPYGSPGLSSHYQGQMGATPAQSVR